MDIDLVCQRLAAAASVIPGLNTSDVIPDAIAEPMFFIGEITVEYHQTFGTMIAMDVSCRLLVSRADNVSGQRNLRQYMAPTGAMSIPAALEAARGAPGSPALSGAADDLVVRRMQGHRLYTVGDTAYVGAEWSVHVIG